MQNCYYPVVTTKKVDLKTISSQDIAINSRLDTTRNTPDEIRPSFFKLGVISEATGSAYVEFHRTRVICSVYGPRNDTRSQREFRDEGELVCDFKYAPFACKDGRRERGQQADELEYSSVITQAISPALMLNKLPKCIISIYIVVLEADGGELCAAINCASLALADAAIEMYDLVVASSAGLVRNTIVLDPSGEEEKKGEGQFVLAYMPVQKKITHCVQTGHFTHLQLQETLDLCTDACDGIIYSMMKTCLVLEIHS